MGDKLVENKKKEKREGKWKTKLLKLKDEGKNKRKLTQGC